MAATEIPGQGGGFLLPEERADARQSDLPETVNMLTPDEIGEILHKSGRDVRRMIERGQLQGYRIGSHYRVASGELARFLEAQRVPVESR